MGSLTSFEVDLSSFFASSYRCTSWCFYSSRLVLRLGRKSAGSFAWLQDVAADKNCFDTDHRCEVQPSHFKFFDWGELENRSLMHCEVMNPYSFLALLLFHHSFSLFYVNTVQDLISL